MKVITLPGLWDKYELNTLFIDYCNTHKDQLKYDRTYFIVYGSFPQDSWAGYRSYHSPYVLYRSMHQVIDHYYQLNAICRFDCSSLLFDPKDYNVFGRAALNIGENGSNQIAISTPVAYNYLKDKFPNYTFVGSELLLDVPEDMDLFTLVRNEHNTGVPHNFPKNKIEKILNNPCNKCSLEQWSLCASTEQTNLATFSNKTVYLCDNYTKNIHITSDIDFDTLLRVQLVNYNHNLTRQLEEYLKAVIKPEFIDEARLYITMSLRKE